MSIFALEIWDDTGDKCSFYTVREDGAENNETDLFLLKYIENAQTKEAVQILLRYLTRTMGDNYGAIDVFFNRPEHQVFGLPHHGTVDLQKIVYHFPEFPLRLYALRINENIVILFNGGIKDAQTNQESSLHVNWVSACNFADKILRAIREGDILIDEPNRKFTSFDGSDDIFL